ncbi:MAG TPA: ABC transporter ATP-binding protein [Burkholderiales bacterium]|nr:ABC transporter ATP-binding protein [Burkholderiales bacterium]
MSAAILSVSDLTVRLPAGAERAYALERVGFEIREGEVLCLVGESGSGKSITAQAIMGLLPETIRPVAGRVLLEGENLLAARPERLRALRGARMTMIFQEPMTALNPVMRCGYQVEELLRQHADLTPVQRRSRVLEMFQRVSLDDPERIYFAYPHQLSGGQRQRIMIAAALILKPALLIADEPTTALDVTTQAEILQLIRALQRAQGTAVLFITHDFGVVAEIADSVAVLRRGELVESGPAGSLLARPVHEYTRTLLAAVPALLPRKQPVEPGRPVHLRASRLSRLFHGGGWLARSRPVRAVDEVGFEVRRGETLGIVGESGSGKSTLARLLGRLIEPSSGEIELDGERITALRGNAVRQLRRRIQFVFQDPYRSLNPRRTAGAAIVEGPMNFGVPAAQAWQRARELMSLVGLPESALGRYPHQFSGGQRQRICIARALAMRPEVLIADEPVSALDVSVQAQILDLFEDIQRRLGLTLLFITHDLRVAAQICNRILVMRRGRVVEQGPVCEVFGHPRDSYTRALLRAAPGRAFAFSGA